MPIFLVFVALLAFMYLVLVRPQQQRLRKQQALVRSVTVGEYVVLQSGIVGRVMDETQDRLQLEIADGVLVEVLKVAVFRRMEPSELAFTAVEVGAAGEAGEALEVGEAGETGAEDDEAETGGSEEAVAHAGDGDDEDDSGALEHSQIVDAAHDGAGEEEGVEGERT
ncbi:MAG: preprotein translocase subunit YajC [Acidimicrobiales bacterium]